MKRAILVGAGTVTGLAAVLLLNPDSASQSSALAPPRTPSTTTDSAPSTAPGSDASAAQTVTSGDPIQVNNFGIIQVQITTASGQITDISALQVPDWDGKSQMINSYAVPQLTASALSSQSAEVAGVSGATFTSVGFRQSLASAIAKSGLG